MSFLAGTSQQPQADLKQLNINSSNASTNEQGNPLPYLAGKRRFAGMFMTDAFDQFNNQQGGGGKDAGKGGGGTGTNYFASFAVAFCVGPCDTFEGIYLNGDDVFTTNTKIVAKTLSEAGNVATFRAQAPHNLTTGDTVLINGANQTEFNGEFTVTVTGGSTFQYTIPGTSLQVEFASGQIYAFRKLDPIMRGSEDEVQVSIPGYGEIIVHWGTETQPADQYLPTMGVAQPPFHGVCYIVFKNFFLGLNQTNIQNIEAVFSRTPTADWQANAGENIIAGEANPAIVAWELLTHPRVGIGLTDADFNTAALATACTQLKAEGLGISPIITRSDSALSFLQQLCESIDAIILLDAAGLLTLILIRAPGSYAGLQVLTDANLADLPKMKAGDWSTTYNQTRIIFPNKDALWNDDFVEWFDFSSITAAQLVAQPQNLQRDWVTDRDNALALVQCAGAIGAAPLMGGMLDLQFTTALWSALAPGTLFQNNFANAIAQRANGYYRVTKRTMAKSDSPMFTIEFQADRSYLNKAT